MEASRASWSRPVDASLTVAALLAAGALFLFGWAILLGSDRRSSEIQDTPVYEKYGDWMVEGQVPYRDFHPEYPPLALPAFVLPSLAVGADGTLSEYRGAFEWAMAVCGLAALAFTAAALSALGAGAGRLVASLVFVAALPLALGPVVLTRFDLWPAALVAAAMAALLALRERLGFGLLAAAVAAKLYAVVLLPLALVWVWRRHGRREALLCLGIFLAVVAACYLPFVVLGADGVAESFGRQLSRPLQLESLGAAVLLSLHSLAGLDVEMVGSHGSQNVAGSLGDVVGVFHSLVQLAVLAAIWWAFARGEMSHERLVRFSAAAILAFVAFGKVLSPQFLIWLAPVVALVAGRRGLAAAALVGAAFVLTHAWFPFRYWDWARTFDGDVTALVLARDLVLVAAVAVLVMPVTRLRRAGARTTSPGP